MVKSFSYSHTILALSGALAVFGPQATESAEQNASIETRGDGLAIHDFTTAAGRVRVYLPDDMAAGDTISGTVTEVPAGQTEAERQANSGVLNGYVVEIGPAPVQRAQNDRPHFHLVTPVVGMTSLILRNGAGQIVGQVAVPVGPQPVVTNVGADTQPLPPRLGQFTQPLTGVTPGPVNPIAPLDFAAPSNPAPGTATGQPGITGITVPGVAPPINTNSPVDFGPAAAQAGVPDDVGAAGQRPGGAQAGAAAAASLFVLPRIGQAGRPLEITGPFDGNSANTSVQIGPRPERVLAESPRKAVFQSPPQPGMTNITVTESGRQATGQFRNIRLDLSAPKTNLLRGEMTTVNVQVQGLAGLTEPVPMILQSSGPIQTQGGNLQSFSIAPAEVNGQGVYTTTRAITGQQAGAFTVQASLLAGAGPVKDDPLFPGAFDMNGIDSAKELLALVSPMNDEERQRRLCATVRALRERIAAATGGTREWLNNKLTMVLSVNETLGITCR